MTESRLVVDSSAWLSYLLAATDELKGIMESEETLLYTSTVTLHEVKRRLLRIGYTNQQAEKAVQFMKENSIIIPVDEKIAVQAVTHCLKNKLHTIDAIIYETALQNNCKLITGDFDFKNLKDTIIITT